jgi:hypothetical protein
MRKFIFSLLVFGLIGLTPSLSNQASTASATQAGKIRFTVLDVAFDARTFTFNHANPASNNLARGDTFVLNGKIFIAGAIPSGGTPSNPGPFSPDAPGSIGKFICRGTSLFDGAEVAAGAAPFVATTQTFVFDNGNWLFTEGLEGNFSPITRAVTGGLGDFSGMRGEVTMELLGFNSTGMENYRFTFRLKK